MSASHQFTTHHFAGMEILDIEILTEENFMTVFVFFKDKLGEIHSFTIWPHRDYAHISDLNNNSHYAVFKTGELLPEPPWKKK